MDMNEQLDRAIGDPAVPTDLDAILATGRQQRRRRRSAFGGLALAVVAATGLGAWWAAPGGEDTPREAADLSVAVTTCTPKQAAEIPAGQDTPFVITGRGSLCTVPGAEPLERIDTPIPGKRSVALRLVDPSSKEMGPVNLLVVWGGYGLGEDYPVVEIDFDWEGALLGTPGTPTSGVTERPLSEYVAERAKEGVAEPAGRTDGWEHCDGAEEPLVQTGDQVCVGAGYEVLTRASAAELATQYLDQMSAALDPASIKELRSMLPTQPGAMVWEVVDRTGHFRYIATGAGTPLGTAESTPMRMPLSLALGLFSSGSGSAEGSAEGSSDLPGDDGSSAEMSPDLLDAPSGAGSASASDSPSSEATR